MVRQVEARQVGLQPDILADTSGCNPTHPNPRVGFNPDPPGIKTTAPPSVAVCG
jgi:hypothetical protein